MKEISLRPYTGRLFLAKSRKDYETGHRRKFGADDTPLTEATRGRFAAGAGPDGMWTYIVWAEDAPTLAHEMAHVVFALFDRVGINAHDSGGEAFCYMLSQLLIDAGANDTERLSD
jgi:hypothetical protein